MVVVKKTTLYPMLFKLKRKFDVEMSNVGHKELILQQKINRFGKPTKKKKKQ